MPDQLPPDDARQHDDLAAACADRLRADPGVSALVKDRVSAGDPAGELPRVTVRKGRAHPRPDPTSPTLAQRDLKVTCEADSEEVLTLLLRAVQRCLNGHTLTDGAERAVLTDAPRQFDEEGGVYSRRDTYGVYVKPARARSGGGSLAAARGDGGEAGRLRAENEELRRRLAAAEAGPAVRDSGTGEG